LCDASADNGIGDEGARALATALQSNHTLTSLYLGGMYRPSSLCVVVMNFFLSFFSISLTMCDVCAGNRIGVEGARGLATALQSNHTLTSLDLECMSRRI